LKVLKYDGNGGKVPTETDGKVEKFRKRMEKVEKFRLTLSCLFQVRWYSGKDGWLTSGTNVYAHHAEIEIMKPAPNEWNLFIKKMTKSFEDTYTCKTDQNEILSLVKVIIESKFRKIILYNLCCTKKPIKKRSDINRFSAVMLLWTNETIFYPTMAPFTTHM
jgi:hypothetical protein